MFYNIKGEKIYFIKQFSNDSFLNVYLAGQTCRDPRYRSAHNMVEDSIFDRYQFEYVLSGTGYIETVGAKHRVNAGDFFFLNKSRPHYYYSDPSDPFEKVFVTVNGRLIDHLTAAYGLLDSVVIKHVDVGAIMLNILRVLDDAYPNTPTEKTALLLHEVIQCVQKDEVFDLANTSNRMDIGNQLCQYVHDNIEGQLSLKILAENFCLSESQIIRTFKSNTGKTPKQYIIDLKIDIAKDYLSYTNLSIEEIADRLLFSSHHHFSQLFTNRVRVTPLSYRKMYPYKVRTISDQSPRA
ncbi:MAG: AraC family transcriptional regulator [Capsulimonadaceae bacterium]|nr:AraC family transcriptional regulator [Capsulimonadaceae bacterium]